MFVVKNIISVLWTLAYIAYMAHDVAFGTMLLGVYSDLPSYVFVTLNIYSIAPVHFSIITVFHFLHAYVPDQAILKSISNAVFSAMLCLILLMDLKASGVNQQFDAHHLPQITLIFVYCRYIYNLYLPNPPNTNINYYLTSRIIFIIYFTAINASYIRNLYIQTDSGRG